MKLAILRQLYHKANWGKLEILFGSGTSRVLRIAGVLLVPSLIRFVVICGVLAGLAYGGMFALATFVEPDEREMRVKIPSKRINQ